MERVYQLLMAIWQEVGQHLELAMSLPTLAQLLAKDVPLDMLAILALDPARRHLHSRTVWLSGSREAPHLPPLLVEREWRMDAGSADAALAAGPIRSWLQANAPQRDAVMLSLKSEGVVVGMAIAAASANKQFDQRQRDLLQQVAEPLAAALQNDTRLGELKRLRERAEAEQRSALTRLGRNQLVDEIVGADGGLKLVMARARLVAAADAPVLILGETGAGKEVIARAIHEHSPRRPAPFMRVNCGAIPPELIDSHLFGHEKGSFTGATEQRKGWFERANGGTLFLDEIGELPLAAQVRLLRVLQEGEFERVGGQKPLRVSVRVLTATHRDLARLVREGKFREDLWYRIAVFPILLPPLRDRQGDIDPLAHHFAERAATRFGLRPCMPSAADVALLQRYPWPGNVRELATVIERAAILGNGERLDVEHALGFGDPLQAPLAKAEGLTPQVVAAPTAPAAKGGPEMEAETLNEAMRRHIEAALRRCHGRISGPFGAAQALNIHPNTLRARMQKLGVERRKFRS